MRDFNVDLDELDATAGKYVKLANDVRDGMTWGDRIDTERWPENDPVRAAVITYQRSLREAVGRLCDRADDMATSIRDIVEGYRDIEAGIVVQLRALGDGDAP